MHPKLFIGSRRRRRLAALPILAALCLATLAACDNTAQMTIDEHLERAREYQLSGDLRASIIELKNGLQKAPDSAAARFLLGGIYNQVGESENAEKELRQAAALGMDRKTVNLPLGRALEAQGKFQKILDEITFESADATAYKVAVLNLHGAAYRGLHLLDDAGRSFQAALALEPASHGGLVGLARVALDRGNLDAAEQRMSEALAVSPGDLDVIALSGDIAFQRRDFAKSEAIYLQLVKDNPNYHVARMGLALSEISTGELTKAKRNLDLLLLIAPNHAYTNFLRALAAYQAREYEDARTYAKRVFRRESGHLPTLLIDGSSAFALGQFEQAGSLLERFLARVPGHIIARRLEGITLLRLNQPKKAMEVLAPLAEQQPDDADILALVGTAAVRAGDIANASRYLESAVALSPGDIARRVQLGLVRAATGQTKAGLADLKKAVELDPLSEKTRVSYITVLLRAKEYDQALAAAKALATDIPDAPLGLVLTGQAQLGLGARDQATAAFKKALEINPANYDASHYLAVMAIAEGDIEQARRLYQAVLKKYPDYLNALLNLAQLETKARNHREATRLIELAVQANGNLPALRVILAQSYLRAGNPIKALAAVNPIAEANPRNAALLEVTGKAQLAVGQAAAALDTFELLSRVLPRSPDAAYMVATAHQAMGDLEAVGSDLEKVLALDSNFLAAKILQAKTMGRRGDLAGAQALIAGLERESPENGDVLELEGNLALAAGRGTEAIKYYQRAGAVAGNSDLTVKLAMAHWQTGDRTAAYKTFEDWLETYPRDVGVRLQLASTYGADRHFDDAIRNFKTIIQQAPEFWQAKNDMAWTYMEMGELDKALALAEEAHTANAADPDVADTLGLILLRRDRTARAERLLRQAATALPDDPTVGFHLAQALAQGGNQDEARTRLRDILATDSAFADRDAAQALLNELSQ